MLIRKYWKKKKKKKKLNEKLQKKKRNYKAQILAMHLYNNDSYLFNNKHCYLDGYNTTNINGI
jgi:hypothetical protein